MIRLLTIIASLLISATSVFAAPKVVASIRPLHSIVSAVMGDVGAPTLLLTTNTSPHTATLKPSQASALQAADLVFWVGPELETFMTEPLKTLSAGKNFPLLARTKGLTSYDRRGKDEHDDHDDHKEKDGHDDHKDEHAHDDHDEHKDEKAHDDHDDGHNHVGTLDVHIWVDPQNAGHMAQAIALALSKIDLENAETYKANSEAFVTRASQVEAEIAGVLKSKKATYFVQHDAFQYFEKRFDLSAPIVLTINPEVSTGAASVKELRAKAVENPNACLLTEPQFNPALANTVFEGQTVKRNEIDIMGQKFATGPDHYFETLNAIAASFADCLRK